jgi:hypothetical protein
MLCFLENQTEMMPERMAVSSRKSIEGVERGVEKFREVEGVEGVEEVEPASRRLGG